MSDPSTIQPEESWDTLPGLIWSAWTDSVKHRVNRRWLQFTGRALEEETGEGWIEGIHREDRQRLLDVYRKAFEAHTPFHVEYRLRHKDGEHRLIAEHGTPSFDAEGGFTGFIGCGLPVAPRLHSAAPSEDRNRQAHSSHGVFRTGPEGGCRYIDEWWTQVTGMGFDEVQGGRWLHAIHPHDRERAREEFQNSLRSQEEFNVQCRLVSKEGAITEVRFQGGPQLDEGGILTGFEAKVSDVTEEGDPAQDEQPVSKVESLTVLAGSIAHDFNNLLTPILLNLAMALNELKYPDAIPEVEQRLEECEQAALRAKTLTNHLLAFAKGANPIKEIVDLQKLIRDTAMSALGGGGVQAAFSFPDELWNVNLDPDQFREVLIALLKNAEEAMPTGGTVFVQVYNVKKVESDLLENVNGPHVHIRIQDEGSGVGFDVMDKIFDPYFSTKPEGSGLGLPTAQAIVRNHGGQLIYDAGSGSGAAFSIYLPVATAPAPNITDAPASASGQARAAGSQGRVLVMDDEELVRSSLESMLKAYGYEVETARNGDEALDAFAKARDEDNPIDITLMDLTIHGGMGGKEAICRLREMDPAAKAVVCSGYSNDPIMSNFQNYGFKAAIKKPFHPEELNRVVLDLIEA